MERAKAEEQAAEQVKRDGAVGKKQQIKPKATNHTRVKVQKQKELVVPNNIGQKLGSEN